jgi:hypothetical protein
MRAPFIALGIAATALAGWLLFPHGERGRKAAAAPTAHHDEAGDALAAMNERLASLERREALRSLAKDAPAPSDTAAPAAAPAASAAAPRPARRTGDALYQGLERHFAGEARDPAWSAQVTASVGEALQDPAFAGSTLLHAECGTTLCRVDVAHDGFAAEQGFFPTAMSTPPFDHGGMAHRVHDPSSDKSRTVVYFAREGHTLPSLDEG